MRWWNSHSWRGSLRWGWIVILLGVLAWGVQQVWDLQAAVQGPAEPSNIVAARMAESGALHEPALIEFYSDDCSICRRVQGPVAELDQRHGSQAKFVYIDTDVPSAQSLMAQYHVRGLPTFVLLDGRGKEVLNVAGWPGEQVLDTALDATARSE